MALECGRHDDGMNGGFIVQTFTKIKAYLVQCIGVS